MATPNRLTTKRGPATRRIRPNGLEPGLLKLTITMLEPAAASRNAIFKHRIVRLLLFWP